MLYPVLRQERIAIQGTPIMLFLVISTPRPERPAEIANYRQSFWPWIARYQESGIYRHVYARVGRGAAAIFDVASNEALHLILNEWADIIPAHFDTYPLVDLEATKRMLAAQMAAQTR
jgi:muconolactone delta-isomerase